MITVTQITDEVKKFFTSLKENDRGKLISYVLEPIDFNGGFNYSFLGQNYDKIIIFNKPSEDYKIIGLNTAFEFADIKQKKFSDFTSRLKDLNQNSLNNFGDFNLASVPLIFIISKFDVERTSASWKNFNQITFVIPKILILQKGKKTYLIYNFIYAEDEDYSEQITKLKNLLSNLVIENPSSAATNVHHSMISSEIINESSGWEKLIKDTKLKFKDGIIQKLVLSRAVSFELNRNPDWNNIFIQLTAQYTDCYLFLVKSGNQIFFGASPEKFLSSKDEFIEVEAVAGSAPRGKLISEDIKIENDLFVSTKIRKEHTLVSNFINQILNEFSGHIYFPESPQVRKLDNIQHLVTKFTAGLSKENIFSLMDRLFPTPAVCGFPKEAAISVIRELEKHDRGLYSGILGWVDFNGNCDFTVSIRSALVEGKKVTAFAGAGIVEESDPADEFYETELKLKPIISLFQDDEKS